MKSPLARLGAAIAIGLFMVLPAMAQSTTSPPEVDISNIQTTILQIVAAIFTALGSWVFMSLRAFLATKSDLANSEAAIALQARFNEALPKMVNVGLHKAEMWVTGGDGKVQVSNEFLAEALSYGNKAWPGLMKHIDIEHLEKAILARYLPSAKAETPAPAVNG